MDEKKVPYKGLKALLFYGLAALALYFCWVVGSSFVHLNMFIFEHGGWKTAVEGFFVYYFGILVISIIYVNAIMLHPSGVDATTKKVARIVLTTALIPGVNFVLPFAAMAYFVVAFGIKLTAYVIVLFETVFSEEKK